MMVRRAARAGSAVAAALLLGYALFHTLAPLPPLLRELGDAPVVVDRNGGILREHKGEAGLRAESLPLSALPRGYVEALLASEDHRFYAHPGVDVLGLVRAAWLDLRTLRPAYGGSTLAMQLARIAYDLPRSFTGKLRELVLAPILTARLGRAGVLHAYVNLAPFGRDLRGVRAASRAYFGKPAQDLTLGEAVALACLPRAPSAYDPHRHADRLVARRDHVLALLAARGGLTAEERTRAEGEPLRLRPFTRTFRAPHAVDLAVAEASALAGAPVSRVETTLDPRAQELAERACADAVASLAQRGATGCAAVVLDAATMEVRALVGSPSFSSPDGGQVNAAVGLRQPGSALKPFAYALAFEDGASPGDEIDDAPVEFATPKGPYRPHNYDHTFHGRVTLREALANSYNVPALRLVQRLGVSRFHALLGRLGFTTLSQPAEHYGVGLVLGDGEVRLSELTAAYAVLARGGSARTPTLLRRVVSRGVELPLPARPSVRVLSSEAAYVVGDVLSDDAARRAAFGAGNVLEFPFPVAVKTGTSSRYRDNVTLGYAGDLVVGVWVGRHDGASLHGVSGVAGAAPAFRRIVLGLAHEPRLATRAAPPGVVRVTRGARVDLAIAP
jgi:penicillin-binding protein 1C